MELEKSARSALKTASKASPVNGGALAKPAGLAAAGVGLAALPFVVERLVKVASPKAAEKIEEIETGAKDKVKEQVKDAVPDLKPEAAKGVLGGIFSRDGGDDDDEKGAGDGDAAPGYGSGRRMPIQQSVDVAVPVKVAYDQWTQFEDWPEFMHRLESVEQVDNATVAFQTKIWGVKKRFEAEILDQRPEQRVEWDVSEGFSHTGVVTFHELSDRLTRIELTMDVEPDNLIDKASRGMRFVKRAVRGDLHRFKAYVELNEDAENGWQGTIEDGKVKRRTQAKSRPKSSGGKGKSGGARSKASQSRS
jgi:uncharacterized membrane protein